MTMIRYLTGFCTALLLFFPTPGVFGDTCDLAGDVAERAADAFRKDKAKGLKLFIKAHKLCPDDAAFAYNLGMAYYGYGSYSKAQEYLSLAVKKDGSRWVWLNNLASVILERGKDFEKAVYYAEEAVKSNPDSPEAVDTLARAHLANGDFLPALEGINKAKKKWPENETMRIAYQEILDDYLSHYLEKIKSGKVEEGLAGLRKAESSPRAVRAYCLALAGVGKPEEALGEAKSAAERLGGPSSLNGLFDEIMSRNIQGLYRDFKEGKASKAVAAAKELSEKYPENGDAKKAYNELFDAFLADDADIPVPERVAEAESEPGGSGQADRLLEEIWGGKPGAGSDKSELYVDVDAKIPQGAVKRPYAVAVVIGNQRYKVRKKGISDVKYAERDAAVMRKYLVQVMGYHPDNIIYRTNVTSGDLRTLFGSKNSPEGKLHDYLRKGKSQVFIYYVGHGAPGPDGGSAYLVPVDAVVDYIANNGYPLDLFYRILSDLPAKNITVVLDACFSGDSAGGPLFKKISPAMLKSVRPVRKMANSVVFCGADKDQVCTWYPKKRHSLFTYFFLKGLGGAADGDRDKKITSGEMADYLAKEVPYYARRESHRKQNPLIVGDKGAILAELK